MNDRLLSRTPENETHILKSWRWLLVFGLLACVGAALVIPFPLEGRLWGELFDLAHAPVFFLGLLACVGFLDPSAIGLPDRFAALVRMTGDRILLMSFVLAAVGGLGEYLQRFVGRSSSWSDVAANTIGLTAAVCWIAARSVRGVWGSMLKLAAVVLLIAVSIRPMLEAWDCVQQRNSFPLLASFERTREPHSWIQRSATMERSQEWSSAGQWSARIQLPPSKWPGVAMAWFERDWRGFHELTLDMHNPNDEPLDVVVKIFDRQHAETGFETQDRFHHIVTLAPGLTQHVRIDLAEVENAPVGRRMNMEEIWLLEFFCAKTPARERVLFLDNIRLASNGNQQNATDHSR
ncbi:MAG: hypothetical protein R3C49_08760 [Planctomycetaceae bacterium]